MLEKEDFSPTSKFSSDSAKTEQSNEFDSVFPHDLLHDSPISERSDRTSYSASVGNPSFLDSEGETEGSLTGTTIPQPPPLPQLSTNICSPPPPPTPPLKDIIATRVKASQPPPPFPSTLASHPTTASFVPQPPPPPPPPTAFTDPKISSLVPPPPPPPPLTSKQGESNSTSPFHSLPPPPPFPMTSRQVGSTSTPSPVPPPPPPLSPRQVGSNSASPSAPPPPPPPASTKGSSPPVPSAPPPPRGTSKSGEPLPDSLCRSTSSGPPCSSPSGGKGRSLSRTLNSRTHITKKLKPLHWLKLSKAVQGSLWAEAQKTGEAAKYANPLS